MHSTPSFFPSSRLQGPHLQPQTHGHARGHARGSTPRLAARQPGAPLRPSWLAAAVACACAAPIHAQTASPGLPAESFTALPAVEVRADSPVAAGASPGARVLSGERLLRQREATLGATLDGLPGVASSGFGPAVGRPVVRGQDGDRVTILSNGSASLDASSLSQDHAVPLEPLVLDRIELLRGPAALRYSSHAVGGVIQAVDNRIPRERAARLGGQAELRLGGASDQRAGAIALDGGTGSGGASGGAGGGAGGRAGGDWAWHVDAFSRDSDALRAPRHTVETEEGPVSRRRVANSGSRADGGGVGATWFGSRGWLGASFDGQGQVYGSVADEEVSIRMRRNTGRLAGQWAPGGWLAAVRGQVQLTDYRHTEMEGGEPGTVFSHEGTSSRLEADHQPVGALGGMTGTWGLQADQARFAALGEEAFVPRTRSRSLAWFVHEQWQLAPVTLSLAVRGERSRVSSAGDEPDADEVRFGAGLARRFSTTSVAVGGVADLGRWAPGWQLEANLAHTERAPTYYELFANGIHVATAAYEAGDNTLGVERGVQGDAALVWRQGGWQARLGGFASRFGRYIALQRDAAYDTVEDGETLPGYRFGAVRARLWGLEAELAGSVQIGGQAVRLEASADSVRAVDRDSGQPLPRIAPLRLALGAATDWLGWTWRLDVRHAARQGRVSADDVPTPGYTLADVSLSRALRWSGVQGRLFLRLDNVTDELATSATTLRTVRELTPLGGRALSAGLRVSF